MEATFDITGLIFSGVFAIECLVKVLAMGFFFGAKSYLAEAFNYLDFFIVVLGILDFVPSDSDDGGGLSALRALRVMRPLRAVSRFPELKFIVVLLIQCVPKLGSVLQVCACQPIYLCRRRKQTQSVGMQSTCWNARLLLAI